MRTKNEFNLPIRDVMTATPFSIGREQSLQEASRRMRKHNIRHLPVLEGGTLVGILSDRDIDLVETLPDVDPERVSVEEAMTSQPYTVTPDTPLAEVVRTMAQHKYGTAVVMEGANLVGIFTTVDGMREFARFIEDAMKQ